MRIIILFVALASAVYGGFRCSQDRDAGDAAVRNAGRFTPVEMPDGAGRGAVLVLAPRNCPSDQARRTQALIGDLEREGMRVIRGDSISFDVENPSAEQVAGIRRAVEVFRQGAPAVYLNGIGMSNPSSAQVIAEYKAGRAVR